jgi:hypothetical protein
MIVGDSVLRAFLSKLLAAALQMEWVALSAMPSWQLELPLMVESVKDAQLHGFDIPMWQFSVFTWCLYDAVASKFFVFAKWHATPYAVVGLSSNAGY